jgi:hypothetical protein
MALSPLTTGISDAVGFLGGALAGYWLGQLSGADIFAPGYGAPSLIGIVLVSVGGGLGLRIARRWQNAQHKGQDLA